MSLLSPSTSPSVPSSASSSTASSSSFSPSVPSSASTQSSSVSDVESAPNPTGTAGTLLTEREIVKQVRRRRAEKSELVRLRYRLMRKKHPWTCLMRVLEVYDPGKIYDPVSPYFPPKEILDEIEKIFGYQDVNWPDEFTRQNLLGERVEKEIMKVLMMLGYRRFTAYGDNGRGYLEISPREGQDAPPLPKWLQIPYLVPIKGYSLCIRPEATPANPAIETGASLYEMNGGILDTQKEIGTLGPIMSSSCPGKTNLVYVALTAGHVIPNGVDYLTVCNPAAGPTDPAHIILEISRTSKRLQDKRLGRKKDSPAFTDDVGFLLIRPDDIKFFRHHYKNVNAHFFNSKCDGDHASIKLDPERVSRFTTLKQALSRSPIAVFKQGCQTDLTMGHLVRLTCDPPEGWYTEAANGQSDVNNSDLQQLNIEFSNSAENSDGFSSSTGSTRSESIGGYGAIESSSDEDGQRSYGWFGIVKWSTIPFAAPGDSGSLVYAIESGIFVPIGIHIGSPASVPGHSYCLSLETFCYEGESEG